MTNKWIAGLFALMLAATSWTALADTLAMHHTCTQPYIPEKFQDNHEVAIFNEAVADYKQCISDFADQQHQAADLHRRAAGEAIDAWNAFLDENDLN